MGCIYFETPWVFTREATKCKSNGKDEPIYAYGGYQDAKNKEELETHNTDYNNIQTGYKNRIWLWVMHPVDNEKGSKKTTDWKELRGSLNKFPVFFRMGTFIDSTHMKL